VFVEFESVDPQVKSFDKLKLAKLIQEIEKSFEKNKKISEGF
jgi:hypothetical protein